MESTQVDRDKLDYANSVIDIIADKVSEEMEIFQPLMNGTSSHLLSTTLHQNAIPNIHFDPDKNALQFVEVFKELFDYREDVQVTYSYNLHEDNKRFHKLYGAPYSEIIRSYEEKREKTKVHQNRQSLSRILQNWRMDNRPILSFTLPFSYGSNETAKRISLNLLAKITEYKHCSEITNDQIEKIQVIKNEINIFLLDQKKPLRLPFRSHALYIPILRFFSEEQTLKMDLMDLMEKLELNVSEDTSRRRVKNTLLTQLNNKMPTKDPFVEFDSNDCVFKISLGVDFID